MVISHFFLILIWTSSNRIGKYDIQLSQYNNKKKMQSNFCVISRMIVSENSEIGEKIGSLLYHLLREVLLDVVLKSAVFELEICFSIIIDEQIKF